MLIAMSIIKWKVIANLTIAVAWIAVAVWFWTMANRDD